MDFLRASSRSISEPPRACVREMRAKKEAGLFVLPLSQLSHFAEMGWSLLRLGLRTQPGAIGYIPLFEFIAIEVT